MKKIRKMSFASRMFLAGLLFAGFLSLGTIVACRRAPPPESIPAAARNPPPPVAQKQEPSYPVSAALDYAWKFAVSITDDAKDRGRTQERVALAYLERGNPAKALEFAAQFGDWRKPLVVAETAAWMARHGRKEEARKLIEDARRIGLSPTDAVDWRSQEAFMRMAEAQACLGEAGDIDVLADMVKRDSGYLGRVTAYKALCLAHQGKSQEALKTMDAVAAAHAEFDELLWRVDGFRLLAESGKLDPAETRLAIDKAAESARRFSGTQRLVSLMNVADTASRILPDNTGALVHEAVREAMECTWPDDMKSPLLARAMIFLARQKQPEKLAEIASTFEKPAWRPPHLTADTAEFYGFLAEAYAANGDREKAIEALQKGLRTIAGQSALRVRGMAAATLCLSMDRCGFGVQELRTEWDGLLEGAHARSP